MTSLLTQEQWDILDGMRSNLGLAADLAQAKISLILPLDRSRQLCASAAKLSGKRKAKAGGDICFLSVFDQAEPLTRSENTEPEEMTRAADEPLMTQALTENTVTEGFRAAFEDREADVVFWDATMDFLNGSKTDYASNSCYRRLSSIDGLVLVNARDGLILAANNAARHIYRVLGVGHLVGRRTSSEEINWNGIDNVLYTGTAEEQELQKKGLFLDFRFIPLHAAGSIERIIVVIVKNNLQTIASLLRLEQRRAASEETKVVLRDSINRISSIALVHEYLSGQGTELVDINELGNGVYRTVMSSMKTPDLELEMKFSADNLRLPSQQAASLALVLNELLQNALEHGFENRKKGTLTATISRLEEDGGNREKLQGKPAETVSYAGSTKKENDDRLLLLVTDDGVGLPAGFDLQKTKSLGLKIVQTVVQSDLKGTFTLEPRTDGSGTVARVVIHI